MFRVLGIYNFALLLAVKTKKRKKNKPNQNTLQRFRAKLFQTLKVIFECLKLETAILICNWYVYHFRVDITTCLFSNTL